MRRERFHFQILFVLVSILNAGVADGQVNDTGIGYPSPGTAMEALHARPDVLFSFQNGWIVASDRANMTVWSFAPVGAPAFPTAVKRQVVQSGDKIYVATKIMCRGTQEACEAVSAEFNALDQAAK